MHRGNALQREQESRCIEPWHHIAQQPPAREINFGGKLSILQAKIS
jgi:hypothetical protein